MSAAAPRRKKRKARRKVEPIRITMRHPASVEQQGLIMSAAPARGRRLGMLARSIAIHIINLMAIPVSKGGLGACTKSVGTLAKMFGASERSTEDALRELRAMGWLRTKRRRNTSAARWIELAGQSGPTSGCGSRP